MTDQNEPAYGAKGAARRAHILETASRLFGEHGYAGVSLRDIARAAGVTHPLLVHYFGGKEDLLRAVTATWMERAQGLGLLDDEHEENRPAQIVRLAEENLTVPGYLELFTKTVADATSESHPLHEEFVDRYAMVPANLTRTFERLRASGLLREGVDPEVAARSVIALEDGAQLQWVYHPDEVDIPRLVRAYLDQILVRPVDLSPSPDKGPDVG
ncbi:TetR/AcrR family transcriptional regulator [Microbacterium indicum]|uniref:TetR/AcrR family transcriptional regulator n=1 Tax=Microbacterium indicum TaxID=358100 RepID=UPI000415E6E8|nr:TetR/AcrR family transcriptional regulator [Microbacterium indicum]